MRQGQAGFTLVEALVALAILSAVLIAACSALTTALSVAMRAAARRDAVAAVERQVDGLRARGLAQSISLRGTSGTYRWQVRTSELPAPSNSLVRPLRILGQILPAKGAAAETVMDTVILGRAK